MHYKDYLYDSALAIVGNDISIITQDYLIGSHGCAASFTTGNANIANVSSSRVATPGGTLHCVASS